MEMIEAKAGGHPVIEDHAVLAQHQAIAAAALRQSLPAVGIDAVEKFSRVRALDINLAQGRGIHQAQGGPRGQNLAVNCRRHGFANPISAKVGIIIRSQPLAHRLERRAIGLMPGMHRRAAHWVQQPTDPPPGQGAKGNRGERWPESGVANLRNINGQGLGDDTQGVDIRGPALVRAHASGGIALHMLDGAIAFPRC